MPQTAGKRPQTAGNRLDDALAGGLATDSPPVLPVSLMQRLARPFEVYLPAGARRARHCRS